ncbi:hypothetical protein [Nostoc sp.]|uniref:hypothetical protein n=1 Tax=Nostoc sp. TaxID=1180 RepID=UPI002FFCDA71
MSFLKAFLASACGWRSQTVGKTAPSLLEKMDNTLGKSGECRGVMLEFEDCLPQKVCSTACRCPAVD